MIVCVLSPRFPGAASRAIAASGPLPGFAVRKPLLQAKPL